MSEYKSMTVKLHSGCPLCEERADMHDGATLDKHTSWHLRREHYSRPTLHVTIESKRFGIAMADEIAINYCPICGKELNGGNAD